MSKIAWTNETWNPLVGCSHASPGCDHCYAERLATRGMCDAHKGLTKNGKWTGEVRFITEALDKPLHWKKPRMIFVGSMTDLFHPNVKDQWLDQIFAIMALCPQHTFQVLTKRSARMWEYMQRLSKNISPLEAAARGFGRTFKFENLSLLPWPLPNVMLGVTAENQEMADARIPILLDTPAAKRFVSVEPMLGPVDLQAIDFPEAEDQDVRLLDSLRGMTCDDMPTHPSLDWVICGGESGPGARPMHPEWVRSLRDQCKAANVPYFFKQWGSNPHDLAEEAGWLSVFAKGGNVLDGRYWEEFPS